MLVVTRITGDYYQAALALIDARDGRILGEILVLRADLTARGNARVRLGLNLSRDIVIVRADAQHRPDGPSGVWLAQQAETFAAMQGLQVMQSPIAAPHSPTDPLTPGGVTHPASPAMLPVAATSPVARMSSSSGRWPIPPHYAFRGESTGDPADAPTPAGQRIDNDQRGTRR